MKKYEDGFDLTLHESYIKTPIAFKPLRIFVCSMSDLFHKEVPFEFIDKVMKVIKSTQMHTYCILTKRAERMVEYFETRPIPPNVWLGVTVESKNMKYRIDLLRNVNATVRFLSCEPLLQDLETINLQGINWVIVGGESESKDNKESIRQMKKEWVLPILKQCQEQNVAFYFKQWGMYDEYGVPRTTLQNGDLLNGKIYREFPIVDVMTANGLLF